MADNSFSVNLKFFKNCLHVMYALCRSETSNCNIAVRQHFINLYIR